MTTLKTRWGRIKVYWEAYFVDHGILRRLYRNFHQVNEGVYRSNHPSPRFVRKLKQKYQLKTIVSLRKANSSGQFLLEKKACEAQGITLINHAMSSRRLPKKDKLFTLIDILENAEKPLLLHCKSGADRAGMAAVVYQHTIAGQSMEQALEQLSWKYGHFRWADTGKLDFFFEQFLAFKKKHPEEEFLHWVSHHYDRDALNKEFKAEGWANILVNYILRRE